MQESSIELSGESSELTEVKGSENQMAKSEQKYFTVLLHLKAECGCDVREA